MRFLAPLECRLEKVIWGCFNVTIGTMTVIKLLHMKVSISVKNRQETSATNTILSHQF